MPPIQRPETPPAGAMRPQPTQELENEAVVARAAEQEEHMNQDIAAIVAAVAAAAQQPMEHPQSATTGGTGVVGTI